MTAFDYFYDLGFYGKSQNLNENLYWKDLPINLWWYLKIKYLYNGNVNEMDICIVFQTKKISMHNCVWMIVFMRQILVIWQFRNPFE